MKKFALAAVAALVATVSLGSVAEARRHNDEDWGRHHNDGDWGHRHNDDDWGRPGRRHFDVIVYRPDCSMTKIIKETDWGTKIIYVKRCD
jgi:hypothetical protein